jgi:hypothetical protein
MCSFLPTIWDRWLQLWWGQHQYRLPKRHGYTPLRHAYIAHTTMWIRHSIKWSDEIVGYANCTSLQFLSHFLTYYAIIAPTEITQNYEHLNTPYDPNQPIKNLFQKIQDDPAFAVTGGQPYEDVMIVNVSFTLVFNTGLFPDACRIWQSRPVADKTWMQFKIDFAVAHWEFRLMNQTAQQSGFHSANILTVESYQRSP